MSRFLMTIMLLMLSLGTQAKHKHYFNATYPDVHDPVMALGEDGRYYIFSTGMGISVMSSSDLKTWRQEPSVFLVPSFKKFQKVSEGCAPLPQWTTDSIKRFHGHIWAPDISHHDGQWYLYYSCSSFGKNGSAIGLATNKTLDPTSPDFKWVDQGPVVVSHRGTDNYNCIDPNLVASPQPSPEGEGDKTGGYLFFGSFWDGIQMVPLAEDLKTPLSRPVTVARRYAPVSNEMTVDPYIEIVGNDTVEAGENAIEAPFVIHHGDWYYLLVSWDYCCRGKKSTYKTVYGRSRSLTGPYLDKEGKDMAQGGGTFLVGPDNKYFGVGHCAAYQLVVPDSSRWLFMSHAYDISKKGEAKLYLRKMSFDKDGWIKLEEY